MEQLTTQGVTAAQTQTFKTITANVGNMLQNNCQVLEVLSKTTGLSEAQILEDFKNGQGPTAELIGSGGSGMLPGGMAIDADCFKYLSTLDPIRNADEYNQQLLGIGLAFLHEYAHWGDYITNGFKPSGQWIPKEVDIHAPGVTGLVRYNQSHRDAFPSSGSLVYGRQPYKLSPFGHRGLDVENIGFGVSSSSMNFGPQLGKIDVFKSPGYPKTIRAEDLPRIPSELPEDVKGNNIRHTLGLP